MVTRTSLKVPFPTWIIRGLGEKEEELGKTLNENNFKISVIMESKKKLQGTKETEHIRLFTVEWTDTSEASQEL